MMTDLNAGYLEDNIMDHIPIDSLSARVPRSLEPCGLVLMVTTHLLIATITPRPHPPIILLHHLL